MSQYLIFLGKRAKNSSQNNGIYKCRVFVCGTILYLFAKINYLLMVVLELIAKQLLICVIKKGHCFKIVSTMNTYPIVFIGKYQQQPHFKLKPLVKRV